MLWARFYFSPSFLYPFLEGRMQSSLAPWGPLLYNSCSLMLSKYCNVIFRYLAAHQVVDYPLHASNCPAGVPMEPERTVHNAHLSSQSEPSIPPGQYSILIGFSNKLWTKWNVNNCQLGPDGTTYRTLPRYHVVTKIVSIYWSNKVTLPCRYLDRLYLLE